MKTETKPALAKFNRFGPKYDYTHSICLTPRDELRDIIRVYHINDATVGHVKHGMAGWRATVRTFNRERTEELPLAGLRILERTYDDPRPTPS